jgi:hypothetical protein
VVINGFFGFFGGRLSCFWQQARPAKIEEQVLGFMPEELFKRLHYATKGGGANLSFLEALFFARQQQCFLPHHHVYGILSLFDLGKISLDIQYKQPGKEVTSKAG